MSPPWDRPQGESWDAHERTAKLCLARANASAQGPAIRPNVQSKVQAPEVEARQPRAAQYEFQALR